MYLVENERSIYIRGYENKDMKGLDISGSNQEKGLAKFVDNQMLLLFGNLFPFVYGYVTIMLEKYMSKSCLFLPKIKENKWVMYF